MQVAAQLKSGSRAAKATLPSENVFIPGCYGTQARR
jgi:hypothetical protein